MIPVKDTLKLNNAAVKMVAHRGLSGIELEDTLVELSEEAFNLAPAGTKTITVTVNGQFAYGKGYETG